MIQGYGPVTQALLGTLLTWGLTALGSAMVIFLRGNQVNYSVILSFKYILFLLYLRNIFKYFRRNSKIFFLETFDSNMCFTMVTITLRMTIQITLVFTINTKKISKNRLNQYIIIYSRTCQLFGLVFINSIKI